MVDHTRDVRQVLIVTLLANEAVAAAKIAWGYHTGSLGMISDGFHSLFDGVTNVVGLIGVWAASHPPDARHPYGHRKFETLVTMGIASLIFLTCYEILSRVYVSLFEKSAAVEVNAGSFSIMVLTICVNLWVMRYESRRGRELRSAILSADALHTKSNVLSSLGVLVGLSLAALGYPLADALAGVVVAIFIARIGLDILKTSADVLVDAVRMDTEEVCSTVLEVEGVRGCHNIRTRGPEHHVHLDLHVQLDPDIPLREAHAITHRVQARLREAYPEITDIVVHTEPGGMYSEPEYRKME